MNEEQVTETMIEETEASSTEAIVGTEEVAQPEIRVPTTEADKEELARIRAEAKELRAQKRVAKSAESKIKHASKLEKAAAALPILEGETQTFFTEVTTSLDQNELTALAAHIQHHVRAQKTNASRELPKLSVGTEVTIIHTSHETLRYLGMTGVVTKSQSIHVLVDVEGAEVYLYRSDVEAVEQISIEQNISAVG